MDKIKKKDIINPFLTFNLRKEQKGKHQQQKIKSFKEKVTKAVVVSVLLTTSATLAADYAASLYGYDNIGIMNSIYETFLEDYYVDLPNFEQVTSGADMFLQEKRYLNVRNDVNLKTYLRFEIEKGSDPIMIYVPSDATAEQKRCVKHSIELYNDVFAIINPAYKLKYTESKKDCLLNPHINFSFEEELISSYSQHEVGGTCSTGHLLGQDGQRKVSTANISINSSLATQKTYIHEMMHAFGIYDLYNLSLSSNVVSVMNTRTPKSSFSLSKNDFYALACLYTDMTDPVNVERVASGLEELTSKYYMPDCFDSVSEKLISTATVNDYYYLRKDGIYQDGATISFEVSDSDLTNYFSYRHSGLPIASWSTCYAKIGETDYSYWYLDEDDEFHEREIEVVHENGKLIIDGYLLLKIDGNLFGINENGYTNTIKEYDNLPTMIEEAKKVWDAKNNKTTIQQQEQDAEF